MAAPVQLRSGQIVHIDSEWQPITLYQCPICLDPPERAPDGSTGGDGTLTKAWVCSASHDTLVEAVVVPARFRQIRCGHCDGTGRSWASALDNVGAACLWCEGRGWGMEVRW